MTPNDRPNQNGVTLSGFGVNLAARGQVTLAIFVLLILAAALGMHIYLMKMLIQANLSGFDRLSAQAEATVQSRGLLVDALHKEHALQVEELQCLTWVLADEATRRRVVPPACVRGHR